MIAFSAISYKHKDVYAVASCKLVVASHGTVCSCFSLTSAYPICVPAVSNSFSCRHSSTWSICVLSPSSTFCPQRMLKLSEKFNHRRSVWVNVIMRLLSVCRIIKPFSGILLWRVWQCNVSWSWWRKITMMMRQWTLTSFWSPGISWCETRTFSHTLKDKEWR